MRGRPAAPTAPKTAPKLAALHVVWGASTRRRARNNAARVWTPSSPRAARRGSKRARGRTTMEVEDSPPNSDVDSDDNYEDDFGEAEAPPDPIATPVAPEEDYEDDFGVSDRPYDAKQEDKYADDFVEDKDDLSIVDDDADSEEDEFEKGLQAAEAAAQQKKLEAAAQQEEASDQSDYGGRLRVVESLREVGAQTAAVGRGEAEAEAADGRQGALTPSPREGSGDAGFYFREAVVSTFIYQTEKGCGGGPASGQAEDRGADAEGRHAGAPAREDCAEAHQN